MGSNKSSYINLPLPLHRFKQAKQQMGLAREFQVRSYAAQIAHTSIVLLRYMMLEYYRRQCSDERTIPGLFHAYVRELQMPAVHVCIQLVLLEVLQLIAPWPMVFVSAGYRAGWQGLPDSPLVTCLSK